MVPLAWVTLLWNRRGAAARATRGAAALRSMRAALWDRRAAIVARLQLSIGDGGRNVSRMSDGGLRRYSEVEASLNSELLIGWSGSVVSPRSRNECFSART